MNNTAFICSNSPLAKTTWLQQKKFFCSSSWFICRCISPKNIPFFPCIHTLSCRWNLYKYKAESPKRLIVKLLPGLTNMQSWHTDRLYIQGRWSSPIWHLDLLPLLPKGTVGKMRILGVGFEFFPVHNFLSNCTQAKYWNCIKYISSKEVWRKWGDIH